MDNVLNGGINELQQIKRSLEELNRTDQELKASEKELKAKQKELENFKKQIEESISSAVKKQRSEIEKEYDQKIEDANRAVKEAENQRKNAKEVAVNLRIKRETASLSDEIKILKANNKEMFKQNKIPAWCASTFYYALFVPKTLKDFITLAITILICAGAIPFVVSRFVESDIGKILVWIIIALVFAAIYILLNHITKKGEKFTVIAAARKSIDKIEQDKKAIRKQKNNITSDKDESCYNLQSYDDALQKAKESLESVTAQRDEAFNVFDQTTTGQIEEQIRTEKQGELDKLEQEAEEVKYDNLNKVEAQVSASKEVEGYKLALGNKYMNPSKLDELEKIIAEGRAQNIAEALSVINNKQRDEQDQ